MTVDLGIDWIKRKRSCLYRRSSCCRTAPFPWRTGVHWWTVWVLGHRCLLRQSKGCISGTKSNLKRCISGGLIGKQTSLRKGTKNSRRWNETYCSWTRMRTARYSRWMKLCSLAQTIKLGPGAIQMTTWSLAATTSKRLNLQRLLVLFQTKAHTCIECKRTTSSRKILSGSSNLSRAECEARPSLSSGTIARLTVLIWWETSLQKMTYRLYSTFRTRRNTTALKVFGRIKNKYSGN